MTAPSCEFWESSVIVVLGISASRSVVGVTTVGVPFKGTIIPFEIIPPSWVSIIGGSTIIPSSLPGPTIGSGPGIGVYERFVSSSVLPSSVSSVDLSSGSSFDLPSSLSSVSVSFGFIGSLSSLRSVNAEVSGLWLSTQATSKGRLPVCVWFDFGWKYQTQKTIINATSKPNINGG